MTLSFIRTERQEQLFNQVAELADEFQSRSSTYDEEASFPVENIEALKKAGYTSLTVPSKYGGEDISLYELVLLQERLAQGDGSTALSIGWHLGIMMDIWEKQDWTTDKIAWIAKEVQNGALINRAVTEPKTGSPTRGGKPETLAKKVNDKWCITGRKTYTTMAPVLDYFIIIASIEGSDQLGEFVIDRDLSGVYIEETWDMISMRGTGSHDLVLDQVLVTEDNLVNVITPGGKTLPSGWLLHIPACYLGIAMAARNYALNFANEYSPNSIKGTIKELPNVQRLVGEIEVELMKARHLMYAVARKWDEMDQSGQAFLASELAAVKYVATNTAIAVVDKAMRIVGAASLQRKNPLQRYYRDVRAGLHNPPMDDMTISNLAKNAFHSLKNK